jgi:hypothetical protein
VRNGSKASLSPYASSVRGTGSTHAGRRESASVAYDYVWLDNERDGVPLVLESEWGAGKLIDDDLHKLRIARAEHRVMIFQGNHIEKHFDRAPRPRPARRRCARDAAQAPERRASPALARSWCGLCYGRYHPASACRPASVIVSHVASIRRRPLGSLRRPPGGFNALHLGHPNGYWCTSMQAAVLAPDP